MILSLDLGLKTGVHLSDNKHAITVQNRPKGCLTCPYYNLYQYLEDLLGSNSIEVIVYEEAKFQQGMAIAYYHGFAAVVQVIGDLWGVPVVPIPVGTIKKSVTGKGNADKEEVMKAVSEAGYTYDDNNSSDAIAVTLTYNELYCNINDTIH